MVYCRCKRGPRTREQVEEGGSVRLGIFGRRWDFVGRQETIYGPCLVETSRKKALDGTGGGMARMIGDEMDWKMEAWSCEVFLTGV